MSSFKHFEIIFSMIPFQSIVYGMLFALFLILAKKYQFLNEAEGKPLFSPAATRATLLMSVIGFLVRDILLKIRKVLFLFFLQI